MAEYDSNHSGEFDQPLAHEAGVNHTIQSADTQLKPQNLRTANFLARRMIGDLQEKIDQYDIKVQNGTIEIEDER